MSLRNFFNPIHSDILSVQQQQHQPCLLPIDSAKGALSAQYMYILSIYKRRMSKDAFGSAQWHTKHILKNYKRTMRALIVFPR